MKNVRFIWLLACVACFLVGLVVGATSVTVKQEGVLKIEPAEPRVIYGDAEEIVPLFDVRVEQVEE